MTNTVMMPNLSAFPELEQQFLQAQKLSAKPPHYNCHQFEIRFEQELAIVITDGKLTYERHDYAPNYRPRLMSMYGDGELLFIKLNGKVILNLLPNGFPSPLK